MNERESLKPWLRNKPKWVVLAVSYIAVPFIFIVGMLTSMVTSVPESWQDTKHLLERAHGVDKQ